MNRVRLIPLLLLALLLIAACSPTGSTQEPAATAAPSETTAAEPTIAAPTAGPTEAAAPTAAAATECPAATDDTYLLRNPQHGYCLLYPTTHKVERPNADEVDLVVGSLLNTADPRANIRVITGDGLSAASFADDLVASFAGFDIARTETTVAGQPAVVLDNVPGQDINRQVIFTLDGRLYHLYFSPLDPANTAPLDDFMAVLLDSFTPMPAGASILPEDECLAAKSEQQAISSPGLGFCLLAPADFSYEETSESNANLFVGSMMDVEHPKLMIEVTDAAGQTATAAADALAASFPDMELQRTFGYTLGYEPAELLDGVPGQDLGRVLLAVHGDRLYRLTFVPADPSQADVYAQMEELFAMVVQTWRFLP